MNKKYHQILDSAAGLHIPDDLDLFPVVKAHLDQKRTFVQTLRARPVQAVLLAILILLLMTGVVYAIGRTLGYFPGIGMVDRDSHIRVLAEPVSLSREGVTVTIEQVVVDTQRTVILYKAEGLTIEAANSKGEGGGPFGSSHQLRLPDGTLLDELASAGYGGTPEPLINTIQTENGWPNYVWRLVYPPVDQQVNELTLAIPVLQNMPAEAAPENWEITFHLKPAPADLTLVPIVELTPQAGSTAGASLSEGTAAAPISNVSSLNGFTFKLDNVIELEDGFVFTGDLTWDASVFPGGQGSIPDEVRPVLRDAGGQQIPIEAVQLNGGYEPNKMPWSYRTNRKAFAGPLVFTIPSIGLIYGAPPVDFQLDLGPDPQVGQSWELTQDFLIEGYALRLLSVEMVNVPQGCEGFGLVFKLSVDAPDLPVNVMDAEPRAPIVCTSSGGGGGGGGGPSDSSMIFSTMTYTDKPVGTHRFSINASIPREIPGPWQITWDPPVSTEPLPTPAAVACLTRDKWNELAGRNDALPPDVGGRIVTTADEGDLLPAIYVTTLGETVPQKLGTAAWPSLSADGTKLAYSGEGGIRVQDLSTGENIALGTDGYRIVWSPDASRLMYTTTFHLYVVNADGSGLQEIDTGSAQVISPAGWLADNQTIVYSTMSGDGFGLRSYNLQSGEAQDLFTIHNKAGYASVSPDGNWIVFADREFGASNWSIFISRVDGSERRLVAEPGVPTAFFTVWGPDSHWLILNTQDPEGKPTPVLVNPFTCQSLHTDMIGSFVEGWGG